MRHTAHHCVRCRVTVLLTCLVSILLCAHVTVGFSTETLHSCFAGPSYAQSRTVLQAQPSDNDDETSFQNYFVRKALFVDMGDAARILTDGFFKDSTNFVTYQVERLKTYLSLESSFPLETDAHEMFVACHSNSGKVLGICEIDGRPSDVTPRPYMCNLAIDTNWRKKGLARALVQACEDQATEWNAEKLSLKVREGNKVAIAMYKSFGYQVESMDNDTITNQRVLLMQKQFPKQETETPAIAVENRVGITAE